MSRVHGVPTHQPTSSASFSHRPCEFTHNACFSFSPPSSLATRVQAIGSKEHGHSISVCFSHRHTTSADRAIPPERPPTTLIRSPDLAMHYIYCICTKYILLLFVINLLGTLHGKTGENKSSQQSINSPRVRLVRKEGDRNAERVTRSCVFAYNSSTHRERYRDTNEC